VVHVRRVEAVEEGHHLEEVEEVDRNLQEGVGEEVLHRVEAEEVDQRILQEKVEEEALTVGEVLLKGMMVEEKGVLLTGVEEVNQTVGEGFRMEKMVGVLREVRVE
jgi:D-alanine-D-alanine ligase-like ATP-grasp enzyme